MTLRTMSGVFSLSQIGEFHDSNVLIRSQRKARTDEPRHRQKRDSNINNPTTHRVVQ